MNKAKKWDEIVTGMLTAAREDLDTTKEYEYKRAWQEQTDQMLGNNLTEDQKELVDEVLLELENVTEREENLLYQQGMKDCVCLLKHLGVLA